MRLTDLKPQLIVSTGLGYSSIGHIPLADGLEFLCPQCFANNNGPVGTHRIICMRPHVKDHWSGPGRWELGGGSYDNMSLVTGSVRLEGGCFAHFLVQNGEIVFCEDSGQG